MDCKKWFAALSCLLLIGFQYESIQATPKKELTFGIIYDGANSQGEKFLRVLEKEIKNLLGAQYAVEIRNQYIYSADWSQEKLSRSYQTLVNDKRIDVILVFGFFSSTAILKLASYPKPVIVVGVIDPLAQGITLTKDNTSGIKNLNYIYPPRSIIRNLELYYSVIPFQRLGIIFDREILKQFPAKTEGLQINGGPTPLQIDLIPFDGNLEDSFLEKLKPYEAILIGFLGKSEVQTKDELIRVLNELRLPSFGLFYRDVQRGVLAVNSAEINILRIIRRIALNVESILAGEDAANLPVLLNFDQKLILNLETARKIGFSPTFSLLTQAEVINEFSSGQAQLLDLPTVFQIAVERNLDIQIKQSSADVQVSEVKLAKSKFLPSLTLSATGVLIDKDRAESSLGASAEKTTYGTLSLNQLLYSESAVGNITIQKEKLAAENFNRESVKLDIMLEAGKAYFAILKAKSLFRLRKDNLSRIKKNLKVSYQKQKVGYTSQADIYSWESQKATETGKVMEARNQVQLAKLRLNQILNRPLTANYGVEDITIEDGGFGNLSQTPVFSYFDNPRSIEILTEFLKSLAVKNSPEIARLEASLRSLNRSLVSLKRQHYAPTLSIGGEIKKTFSESGAGSEPPAFPGASSADDTNWNLALSLSLPLSKGGETVLKSQQLEIEIAKLNKQKQQVVEQIKLNLHAKLLELSQSATNFHLYRKAADLAYKSYEIVRDSYATGTVSIVDLTDAQTNVLNAEIAAVNAVYDFLIDSLEAERAFSDFIILKPSHEKRAFFESYKSYHDSILKGGP